MASTTSKNPPKKKPPKKGSNSVAEEDLPSSSLKILTTRKLTFGRNTKQMSKDLIYSKKSTANDLPPLPYLTRMLPTEDNVEETPLSNHDPLSHRIIEKRRRDRMNNCLADLSRLIPNYYLKKGRGRIEKTEIIEMAIKYMKHLQAHACDDIGNCEITTKQDRISKELGHFQSGYQEAMSETLQFLRDSEGLFSGDSLCVRIMNHLKKHCEKIMTTEDVLKLQGSNLSSSPSSGYNANGSSTGSCSDDNASSSHLGTENKESSLLTEESAYCSDDRTTIDERDSMCYSEHSEMDKGSTSSKIQLSSTDDNFRCDIPDYEERNICESGSNNSSSGEDNSSTRMYKFKSNMKHRFNVDTEHKTKKMRCDSEENCNRFDQVNDRVSCPSETYMQSSVTQDKSFYSPEGEPPALIYKEEEADESSVPIFALNTEGSFYVPLTVDYSIVAPAMGNQIDSSPSLHPVSIHVNFRPRTSISKSPSKFTENIRSPVYNQSHLAQDLSSMNAQETPLGRPLENFEHFSTHESVREKLHKRITSHQKFLDRSHLKKNHYHHDSMASAISPSSKMTHLEMMNSELHHPMSYELNQDMGNFDSRTDYRNFPRENLLKLHPAPYAENNSLTRNFVPPTVFQPRPTKYLQNNSSWSYPG